MVKSRLWLIGLGLVALVLLLSFPQLRLRWERQQVVWLLAADWAPVHAALTPPLCPAPRTVPYLEFFSRTSTAFPQDWVWLTHWGRVLWLNGDCRAAQRLWQIAAEHGYAFAWIELMVTGADVTWPAEVAPDLAKYAAWKGARAKKAELPLAAAWWYKRAWEVNPNSTSAQQYIAFLADQEAKLAVWDQTALRTDPAEADHWLALAKSAELRRQWGVAAVAYEECAARISTPYACWIGAGGAWQRLKAWERAENAYRAAVQARPDLTEPWLNLGHLFRAQKRWDEAQEAYFKAQSLKPGEFLAPYFLGITAYEKGDDASAESYLEQALALKPEYPSTGYYLAQVTYRQGRVEEAERWLSQAVSWNAVQKPYGWALQLGDWRLQLGRCASAREAYDLAREWGLKAETYAARLETWNQQCAPQP